MGNGCPQVQPAYGKPTFLAPETMGHCETVAPEDGPINH